MTCCLLRWGQRPSCPVLDAGPCPRSCWLAARRVGDGLHRLVGRGATVPFCRGAVARAVLQVMPRFQREVSVLGRVRGLFCESSGRDPQHGAGPGEGTGAVFKRSGVFKGIPPLCQCYNACKVWHRCKSGGVAVKTGPWSARAQAPVGQVRSARWPRSPRRADSGALGPGAAAPAAPPAVPSRAPRAALGQASPHWGRLITCPNAQFPTPMACFLPRCGHASCPDGLFPAPMRIGALPQCAVSYPNGPYPAPMWIGALPQWPVSCPGADRRPAPVARILLRCGRARSDHAV